ncbi:MAG: histidinol-phosphatase HisJ family protein [Erysipelotrichaceae bacterium]|nr:histidinol-phosphatase HisJ family protein [Erysipelotrichaceae bacterium]
MLADFHVHSEFSDDSHELMENQIEKAISLGLKEICFTDHVDYGIKKDWSEGNIEYRGGDGVGTPVDSMEPMANVDYPAYFKKLKEMKKKYAGQIEVKQGLEFGIQTHTVEKYEKLYDTYKEELDFVLFSMHQVHDLEFWTQDFQRGKSQEEYNREYYQEILDTMKLFKNYSILSHLDLIVRYDENGRFPFEKTKDIVTEILKLAIKDGKGIEINTSSWHYGLDDTMPSRDLLRLYKELGGTIITIGSDAHTTKYIGDHFDDAVKVLKEVGFTHFATFSKMKPTFHEL